MRELDFISLAPQIGKYFLGEPSKVSSKEIRWGTHGSWCLNTEEGLFYSFEQNEGGGVIWLIEYFGSNIDDVINQFAPTQEPVQQKEKSYTSFTQDQMRSLASEAEIICKYSNTFVVMRFPEGHKIKAKYAPFTFKDGQWYNKRPEGKMPIYLSKGDISEPIISTKAKKQLKDQKLFMMVQVAVGMAVLMAGLIAIGVLYLIKKSLFGLTMMRQVQKQQKN